MIHKLRQYQVLTMSVILDKLGNTYAPSPKDQASIVPPQKGESPKTDAPSLTMGIADGEEDDKKEEVEKTEDEE